MNRRNDALLRLASLRERDELDGERRSAMRGRFAALAGRTDYHDRVITSHNLFPTPPAIVLRMIAVADIRPEHRLLEPSAGTGHILSALPRGCETVAVEICAKLQAHLYEQYPHVLLRAGDFLTKTATDLGGLFHRIIMNPPFKQGEDIRHIAHARTLLEPGGRLVALCYDGVRQHAKLKPMTSSWTPLPPGSFKGEGTTAGVILLTIDAPP